MTTIDIYKPDVSITLLSPSNNNNKQTLNDNDTRSALQSPNDCSTTPSSVNIRSQYIVLSDSDPLIKACKKGDSSTVRDILLECSSDEQLQRYVNGKDKAGSTPIFHTVWNGYYDALEVLLVNGANPNVQNNKANTALHLACEQNHIDVIQLLLSYGANPQLLNYQHKYAYQTPSDPTIQVSVENLVKRFWLEVQRAHKGQSIGNEHVDAKLKLDRSLPIWRTAEYYQQRSTVADRLDDETKSSISSDLLRSILHLNPKQHVQSISKNKHNKLQYEHTTTVLDELTNKCHKLNESQRIRPARPLNRCITHTSSQLVLHQQSRATNDLSMIKQHIEDEINQSKQQPNRNQSSIRSSTFTRTGKRSLIHNTLQRTHLPSLANSHHTATNDLYKTMSLVEQTAIEVEKCIENNAPQTPHNVRNSISIRPNTAETRKPAKRVHHTRHHSVHYDDTQIDNEKLLSPSVLEQQYPHYQHNSSVSLQQHIIKRLAQQLLSV